jgi:hypothetical protein
MIDTDIEMQQEGRETSGKEVYTNLTLSLIISELYLEKMMVKEEKVQIPHLQTTDREC